VTPAPSASGSPRRTPRPAEHGSPQERLRECQANLEEISIALDVYAAEHHGYPGSLQPLVPTYLEAIPHCPNSSSDTYSEGYEAGSASTHNTTGAKDFFYICCKGSNHRDAGAAEDFPAASSTSTAKKPGP
jgi:hypothetical protein